MTDEHQDQRTSGDDDGVRSRTRTRSRTRSEGSGGQVDRSSEQSRSDGRRRRRGRRGRRGRGRSGAGASKKQENTGSSEQADREKTDDRSDDGAAIAPGGTRVAAKRRQRGQRRRGGRRSRPSGVPEEVRRAIIEGPPRTMLVNVAEERTQVAVMEERTLVEHYVTRKEDVSYVGNIYMGRVQNVLPGMEAAFLDIGKGRNGVLYAGEVLYDELDLEEGAEPRIEEVLRPGQPVLVQVTKDPMGTKGARLTMQLSLAGRYMVLAPHDGVFGISRKLTDEERDRLRNILKRIRPDGMGVIVRTAAADATEEQLEDDLNRLLAKWEAVQGAASEAKPLEPVYEEPDLVVRVIRDNFGPHFERLIVDDDATHDAVRGYLEEVMPEALDKLELYDPPTDAEDRPRPLFEAYHVNEQIRRALDRKVWLPSGGYLIFEKTEAMTIIDVNTGKFTGKSNLEETVLKTNLEAADAIVQQLRLRDIGGIIVIDFIDMLLESNQEQVVRRLKRELLRDRTKTRVSEVSRLGLVQMTRKNVSAGLFEVFSEKCETCDGRGRKVTLDV